MTRAAYGAQQASLFVSALAAHQLVRKLSREPAEAMPSRILRDIQQRYVELFATDLANVEAGLYPRELLFQFPAAEYARALPRLAADIPRTLRRKRARAHRDVPVVDPERFPAYFRRAFHWQTDGYFTARSADLYDVGVELLFLGTADVMRRQTIPPITRFLRERGDHGAPRLLDVGCGTGRLLRQLGTAHPSLRLFGVDLSPAYVRAARKVLADVPEVTLAAENAEVLPFRDGTFDIVTSVYMFHELPRAVRRRVLAEIHRVLVPGGLVVIEDSVQLADSPVLGPVLERFPAEFHEPYYGDYLRDDLVPLLESEGFAAPRVTTAYVSKVVEARRA